VRWISDWMPPMAYFLTTGKRTQ